MSGTFHETLVCVPVFPGVAEFRPILARNLQDGAATDDARVAARFEARCKGFFAKHVAQAAAIRP
jgi:hypothetical protein